MDMIHHSWIGLEAWNFSLESTISNQIDGHNGDQRFGDRMKQVSILIVKGDFLLNLQMQTFAFLALSMLLRRVPYKCHSEEYYSQRRLTIMCRRYRFIMKLPWDSSAALMMCTYIRNLSNQSLSDVEAASVKHP